VNTHPEILSVEDNPYDAELTIRALKTRNLANNIVHVIDGQAALDDPFCQGPPTDPKLGNHLKVVLLDLRLPKVDGIEVLRKIRANESTRLLPVVASDFFERRTGCDGNVPAGGE